MCTRSRQKQKHCVLYSLPYNKKVYNLIIADIEAETCSSRKNLLAIQILKVVFDCILLIPVIQKYAYKQNNK